MTHKASGNLLVFCRSCLKIAPSKTRVKAKKAVRYKQKKQKYMKWSPRMTAYKAICAIRIIWIQGHFQGEKKGHGLSTLEKVNKKL